MFIPMLLVTEENMLWRCYVGFDLVKALWGICWGLEDANAEAEEVIEAVGGMNNPDDAALQNIVNGVVVSTWPGVCNVQFGGPCDEPILFLLSYVLPSLLEEKLE